MQFLPRFGAGALLVLALVSSPCSAAAGALAPAPAVVPSSETALTPEAAVTAALSLHPAVLAAAASLEQARGEAAGATLLLSNPSLSGSTSTDGARSGLSIGQPLSLSGEGIAARRSARARVESTELHLARARMVAAAEVRSAFVQAVVRVGQVSVAEDGVVLATRLRDAVARQLEEGEASVLDLRLARLALVQASAALIEARANEAEALRVLSALVGQPVTADMLPDDPVVAAPLPDRPSATERSDVRAAGAALAAAEADLARHRAAALPPVELGAFIEVEDGQTFMGPSLSVALPLFQRNQAGRGQARGTLAVAGAQEAAVAARAAAERQTAQQRTAEADRLQDALGGDPLAEARAALTSIEAGYLAGQIDLPSTVLLQGEVLDGEAAALSLMGGIALARIDLLLATEDPSLLPDSGPASSGGDR